MGAANIAWALFCALGFVGWGVMCKHTGLNPRWIALIVYISALAALVAVNLKPLLSQPLPAFRMTLVMAFWGALNGLAVHFYSDRLAQTDIDPVSFMTMVFAFMVLETPFLSWMVYGKVPNLNQVIAISLAVGAGYFLNR